MNGLAMLWVFGLGHYVLWQIILATIRTADRAIDRFLGHDETDRL